MRNILLVLLILPVACQQPSGRPANAGKADSVSPPPATDTMIPTQDTVVAGKVASWSAFESFDGKYAWDTDLLEKEPLKRRFEALVGIKKEAFQQRLQVAPPIEVNDGWLYNEGTKPGAAGKEEAVIAIDMKKDIIYAGIAIKGIVSLFAEKKGNTFPERVNNWKKKFNGQ